MYIKTPRTDGAIFSTGNAMFTLQFASGMPKTCEFEKVLIRWALLCISRLLWALCLIFHSRHGPLFIYETLVQTKRPFPASHPISCDVGTKRTPVINQNTHISLVGQEAVQIPLTKKVPVRVFCTPLSLHSWQQITFGSRFYLWHFFILKLSTKEQLFK